MGLLDYLQNTNRPGIAGPVQMPQHQQAPLNPAMRGPSRWDRILGGIMPDQTGGLLSQDALKQARIQGLLGLGAGLLQGSGWAPAGQNPTLMQSVGMGIQGMQQGFGNAQATSAQAQLAQQELEAKRAMQAQRQRIAQRAAPQPNESPAQARTRLGTMLAEAYAIGDTDGVRAISEILKSMGNDATPKLQRNDLGDRVEWIDPNGNVVKVDRVGRSPGSSESPLGRMISVTNPQTGMPEYAMMERDGNVRFTGLQPAASKDAAATADERKGAVLLQMVNSAIPTLDEADAPSRVQSLLSRGGLNEALTAQQQINEQAGLLVADAYIRLTSGANAPEAEVLRTMKMITPLPGDKPAMIARKRQTRQELVSALRLAAGRAGSKVKHVQQETPESANPSSYGGHAAPASASKVRQYLFPR